MRVEQSFTVRRPPAEVFAYMTDLSKLASWQPSKFEPGRAMSTHIVEGSMPVDGRWTFRDDGAGGAHVHFVADGRLTGAMRLLQPLVRRGVRGTFRRYHELLARNVEGAAREQV